MDKLIAIIYAFAYNVSCEPMSFTAQVSFNNEDTQRYIADIEANDFFVDFKQEGDNWSALIRLEDNSLPFAQLSYDSIAKQLQLHSLNEEEAIEQMRYAGGDLL